MNCKCISLNRPQEYQNVPTRKMNMLYCILTNGEKLYKDVWIDDCIADDIQKLWDNNIFTLNSCCGHNKMQKSVVISDEQNAKRVTDLLPDFEVCYWKLIKEQTKPILK